MAVFLCMPQNYNRKELIQSFNILGSSVIASAPPVDALLRVHAMHRPKDSESLIVNLCREKQVFELVTKTLPPACVFQNYYNSL